MSKLRTKRLLIEGKLLFDGCYLYHNQFQ